MKVVKNQLNNTLIKQVTAGILIFSISGCSLFKGQDSSPINLFPVSQDVALGKQVKDEINSNPAEYKILERSKYPKAYGHLDRIMKTILNSGELKHKDDFAWESYIIQDDNTLNAFCTPGGYIYVYSGLIKFLDKESDLAGVLGHEIAHADQRHSTASLTQAYGIDILTTLALGEKGGTTIAEVAKGLVTLKFSRNHESDADAHSVKYLCPTEYAADGAASFFKKLIDKQMTGGTPAFLSTHPSPENRVANITAKRKEMACKNNGTFEARYKDFKSSLP